MDRSPLQSTLRELRGHLGDVRGVAALAVVGVVLGLAGPFGTFESMPTLPRTLYWLATVFLTYSFGYGISRLVDRLWGSGRAMWLRIVLMVVAAGLGATLIVALLNFAVFGIDGFSLVGVLTVAAQCLAVAAAVVVVSVLTERPAEAAAAPAAGRPAVLDRVPAPQRGELLALVVEDHYVDIVTSRGKTLVLMRLADAIRETAGVPGLQIHRSHWVARAAVVGSRRSDGKVLVELSNGLLLPVSRSYLTAAREAGLI